MPLYRIADFTVLVEPKHSEFLDRCRAYLAPEGAVADFSISVPEETLSRVARDLPGQTGEYVEFVCVYRAFCNEIAKRGAMLFHAAVIEMDGRGYAFTAPSGTGKSTHISLWRKAFGEKVQIVNGDKPILREKDGVFTAYGTPWCGKEGWGRNASVPLSAVCFLHRDTENNIRRISSEEAVDRVFSQLLKPTTLEGMAETLRLVDLLISGVPMYDLGCNISEEAARVAYETMKEKG